MLLLVLKLNATKRESEKVALSAFLRQEKGAKLFFDFDFFSRKRERDGEQNWISSFIHSQQHQQHQQRER